MKLPALYPIVDLRAENAEWVLDYSEALLKSGIQFLQIRGKNVPAAEIFQFARALRSLGDQHQISSLTLIINDNPELCIACDAQGVHLGQEDLEPSVARDMLGPSRIIGYSTHTLEQVERAQSLPVDYLGFGPIFKTASKTNPDPIVGIEVLAKARAASTRPLTAIGGITADSVEEVYRSGCESVAVIRDLESAFLRDRVTLLSLSRKLDEYASHYRGSQQWLGHT